MAFWAAILPALKAGLAASKAGIVKAAGTEAGKAALTGLAGSVGTNIGNKFFSSPTMANTVGINSQLLDLGPMMNNRINRSLSSDVLGSLLQRRM